jgi:hypothetical protein
MTDTVSRTEKSGGSVGRSRSVYAGLAVSTLWLLTTVHHVYGGLVDDVPARFAVPFITGAFAATALFGLWVYARSGRRVALVTATAAAVVLATVQGGLHGLYAHVWKDVVFLTGAPTSWYVSCGTGDATVPRHGPGGAESQTTSGEHTLAHQRRRAFGRDPAAIHCRRECSRG